MNGTEGKELKGTERIATKYVMFPITDKSAWDLFKEQEGSFWHSAEIDLATDLKDWKKLSDNEQKFIKRVLAFFASADGIVIENLAVRFLTMARTSAQKAFYSAQIFIETVHSEVYSLLIDVLIPANEQDQLFSAVDHIPSIRRKADFMLKWMFAKEPILGHEKELKEPLLVDIVTKFTHNKQELEDTLYAQQIIAFAIAEGVFFSASFCAIYWIKRRGIMPGLTFSNELISRDEGLHCRFACYVYSTLPKLSNSIVHQIFREAMEAEEEFVRDTLSVDLVGINADSMIQYVRYCADRLLTMLDHPKLYNVENPFDFMNLISLTGKTNFFEKRVGEYSLQLKQDNKVKEINVDVAF